MHIQTASVKENEGRVNKNTSIYAKNTFTGAYLQFRKMADCNAFTGTQKKNKSSCHFVRMEEKVSREREERDKNHAVLVYDK